MTKSNLETDIFNYKTPEFYINMKSIPDKTSQERKSFVLEEKRKSREGININGIYIPGGLYFHLNYYKLSKDASPEEISKGSDKKIISLPNLRDNEWIIFNDYDKCQKEGKIYTLFGLRQCGKSEAEVSLCLRELSLFKNTEALTLFQADEDMDTFVKKIRIAIEYGEKFIIVPNIDKDWSKKEIRFGYTKQDNSIELRGTLYKYNTQEGKKIQVGSGKTPTFFLSDEVGKSPFRSVYEAVEPALLTDYGNLRCAPMFTLTGGEAEKAKDAENLIRFPNTERQFTMSLDDSRIIGGRFLDGRYRKDCKKEIKLSEYLNIITNTWLDNYSIQVSQFEEAEKKIENERKSASESPEKDALLLKKIFFPMSLEEVFLMESNNHFPTKEIQLHKLQLQDYKPQYVELYRDQNNKVVWRSSDLTPIFKFPITPKDFKDAPCCMYEPPQDNVPHGTYCIGVDPYNEDTSSDKINSLGSIYVYKRMYNPLGEFQNSIVFSWTGRKKEVKQFHELALMVAEFYNAIEGVLPEYEDKTLIQHFFFKKKGHFLADSFELAKQINPLTKTNRLKGLSASTVNQRHYMNLMYAETKDEISTVDEKGEEVLKMGIYKIPDIMLLEEMEKYKGKPTGSRGVHDGNYDRIIAFGHALTLARYFDIKYPSGRWKPVNEEEDNIKKPPQIRTPWGNYTKGHNNLFIKPAKSSKPINRMFI